MFICSGSSYLTRVFVFHEMKINQASPQSNEMYSKNSDFEYDGDEQKFNIFDYMSS